MTIDNKIRDQKLRQGINREAAKIASLSSGKIVHTNEPMSRKVSGRVLV